MTRRERLAPRGAALAVRVLQLGWPGPDRVANLEELREELVARLLQATADRPHLLVLPGLAALLPACALAARAAEPLDLDGLVLRYGLEATEIWLDWCRTYARALDVALCPGSGFVEREGRVYHVAWVVDRSGKVLLEQPQTHLGSRERRWGVAAGDELRTAELEGARVALLVGVDALYPEVGRILALLGAWLWLSPQAWPAPHDPWAQRAGCWSQVQGNQVYCVEACRVGRWGDQAFAGQSAVWAPVELTPDGGGVLAAAPDATGEAVVGAVVDRAPLRQLHQDYPVFRHLHPALYARYLPRLYSAGAEAVPGGDGHV